MSKGAGKRPARTDIPGPRQTGTIVDWKGAFGFIQPSKPIQHPLAQKRQGKVYLAVEDVVEELEGVGANVSFKLYSDSSGLGAGDVKMAASAPMNGKGAAAGKAAAKAPAKAAAKAPAAKAAAAKPPAAKAAAKPLATKGVGKAAQGKLAKAAAAEEEVEEETPEPPRKFAKGCSKGGDKGKGKGKDKAKGKFTELERTPLHDEPLVGTVVEWKGRYGWIEPNDTIDHPLAEKHRGRIFFAIGDVDDEIEGVGAVVEFMLYSDSRGIGGQNVKPSA